MKIRRAIFDWAGAGTVWGFLVWLIWCVAMSMLATCCGQYISLASDGSGIPRMRALFAGVYQNPTDILSFRTFVAKTLGTIISSATGLSVGRAGPYTHVVACMAYLMSKLSLFRRVYFGPETYTYLRAGK